MKGPGRILELLNMFLEKDFTAEDAENFIARSETMKKLYRN
jgi:hypothetical protein